MDLNILESVSISGLWGAPEHHIHFDLSKDMNFLVGQNGTGKTTVINLISAALRADYERLDKIEFSKILLTLRKRGTNRKPSILVTKTPRTDMPYFDIEYKIKAAATAPAKSFDLDAYAEERRFRGLPPRILRERFAHQHYLDVQKEIQTLIMVCWLSIHRRSDDIPQTDEKKTQSSVDQKLFSLNNLLVRYFSQFSKKYSDHTNEFQKNSFLALLTPEREGAVVDFSKSIDIESERRSLAKVFEVLGVERALYEKKLDTHLKKFTSAVKTFAEKNELTTRDFAAMYNVWKTHSLVQHYKTVEERRSEIFAPQQLFLDTINYMFAGRKVVTISSSNELVVSTQNGRHIQLDELSSGEKQLLIILGEALLQEKAAITYIADEPELSLHVSWQEQLTDAIKRLNPNAQILFATHSPDIVGAYSNNVIDMEDVVK